jgi:hypothetical protein
MGWATSQIHPMILQLGTIPGPGATGCDPFGCIQACSIRMPSDQHAQLQLADVQAQASSKISPWDKIQTSEKHDLKIFMVTLAI